MRVISQNNGLDFPYESIAISRGFRGDKKEFYIFAHLINCVEMDKMPQKIATYSTEEKAEKAMEMLHNDYYDHVAEKTYHEGSYYINPCFQFPHDEDVEV